MTKQFMDKYGRSGTCSDDLATALSYFLMDSVTGKTNPEKVATVAKDNGVAMASWAHLNAGQRRMLLGNVLRGRIRRGGTVHIGEQEFKE